MVGRPFCLGGRTGPGDQWISWIHVHDFLGAIAFIRRDSSIGGKDADAALRVTFWTASERSAPSRND